MDWSQSCSLWGLGTRYPDHFVPSYSAEEEVRKPNRTELCAHKEMVRPEHALSTSEYPSPPATCSALLPYCLLARPHIHSDYLDFIPEAGHLHILLSHHAWVFLSKPLLRFFALGQSHSSTSFPYLVCCFVSSLNHCMLAWNSFLDLHWPGIRWKQISHFLKDSSHVFRFQLIFGAHDVAAPIPSIVLGAF